MKPQDAARFYMELRPNDKTAKSRLLVLGHKMMPSLRHSETEGAEIRFAIVTETADQAKDLHSHLEGYDYTVRCRN